MQESILLPANHLRSISASMYLIEKSIRETEDLLMNKPEGTCYEIINDLDKDDVQNMLDSTAMLKGLVKKLAVKYQVKKNIGYVSRILQARHSRIWEILGETYSRRLKGFGELPQGIADELDKDVSSMIEIIEQIIQTNKSNKL